MGRKIFNFVRTMGEVMSAMWTIFGSAFQLADIVGKYNSGSIFATVVIVFTLLALWRMYENRLRIKPKIEIRKSYPIIKPVGPLSGGPTSTTTTPKLYANITGVMRPNNRYEWLDDGTNPDEWHDYNFGLIEFINKPSIRTDQGVAKNVIAGLQYFTENGTPLIDGNEIIGRWWDEPEKTFISLSESPKILEKVDISPSGKDIRILVVAMKHKDENVFFAYNMDNVDYSEWRKPEYKLGIDEKYVVSVTLAGDNFDDFERWFKFTCSENLEMELKEIEKPRWSGRKTRRLLTKRAPDSGNGSAKKELF